MRQASFPPTPSPRYIKATLITAFAVALLPALFLWSAYADYMSPDWDPSGDSGAVQGFIFIGIASALAVSFASVAFPMTARFLHVRGELTASRFVKVLAVWLAVLSGLTGLAAAGALGSFSGFFSVGLMVFAIAGVLALPSAVLWFKLAQ